MEGCRKRLEEELSCSICLEYFNNPVTLDCGHNFCHVCITNYWGESPRDAPCPQCREMVQAKKMKPNTQLPNIVQIVKEMKNCVVPVEGTVQELKDQINSSLEILRKKKENSFLKEIEDEQQSQDLIMRIQVEREKCRAAFRQHHQFLEFQERLLLTQMDEVEKEITRRRDEHQASLPEELSSLDSLIRELEETQQQSGNEFLQNIENILTRCPKESEYLETQTAFPIALKWRLRDFCDINLNLEDLMTQLQDSLWAGVQLQKANVTLDRNKAHPRITVSENLKCMRGNPINSTYLGRYEFWPVVFGLQVFTSGRHFWEVTVESEEKWCVGVARTSLRKMDQIDDFSTEDVWCLTLRDGQYYAGDHIPLHLTKKLKKIRVTLDCVGCRVAFFDADTGELLYVYPRAFLRGMTLVPLFCIEGSGYLKLCS